MLRLLTLILRSVLYLIVVVTVSESVVVTTVGESTNDSKPYDDYEDTANSCWSFNDCSIAASLHFLSGNVLPITVNCSTAEKLFDEPENTILKRRYENISSVTLDGCGVALNVKTFGFEYIPNCAQVTSLNLKNFYFDEVYEIICETGISLENVLFTHNEFAGISAKSFANLSSIKTLSFDGNNLRHIEEDAFNGLQNLKEITLNKENDLRLRYPKQFANLFQLQKLRMDGVNTVTSDLLQNFPVNLEEIEINKVLFDREMVVVVAPLTLKHLTITSCGLTSAIIKGNEMLVRLNLSANLLTQFTLENCTRLKTIDLSSNKLTHLTNSQFEDLSHLELVYLQKNKLKTLSILSFKNSLSNMQSIDLRNNNLKFINGLSTPSELSINLRIFIDQNPWNCLWLVNVSYNFPEQYRIFRYEKFISKINVNGLECMTYPPESVFPDLLIGQTKNSTPKFTIVYGGPRESKRNQKAEALVIVFMLPLGIAFLFVLLYLWINCQKMFHLSYYRNLPLIRGSADRFDIVRQLPHNNTTASQNQGYEIPMTGCHCDCLDHTNKMNCKINLTYEGTPHQNAAKIYEEIIDYNTSTGNCYYDHLNRDI